MPSDRSPNDVKGESSDWGPCDVKDEAFGDHKITDWSIAKLSGGYKKSFFMIAFDRTSFALNTYVHSKILKQPINNISKQSFLNILVFNS